MFYEIEYKSLNRNDVFLFNENEIWTRWLKYSFNKRKRWEILKCIHYHMNIFEKKVILSVKNVNNSNGVFFGIFNQSNPISLNEHRNFDLMKSDFCRNNTKGFLNIQSLENEIHSKIFIKKPNNIVRRPKLSTRKNHRQIFVNNFKGKNDFYYNEDYNNDSDSDSYIHFSVTVDTMGSCKPRKSKFQKNKLKALNKKSIEYEIKESLSEYLFDKENKIKYGSLKISTEQLQTVTNVKDLITELPSNQLLSEAQSKVEIETQSTNVERNRPYTSKELQILIGEALGQAFIQLFEERPRDPISHLAKILYSLSKEPKYSRNLLDVSSKCLFYIYLFNFNLESFRFCH